MHDQIEHEKTELTEKGLGEKYFLCSLRFLRVCFFDYAAALRFQFSACLKIWRRPLRSKSQKKF